MDASKLANGKLLYAMADAFDKNAVARHLARNEKLLEVLAQHSADRAIPRTIDFFFYASGHAEAECR